MQLFHIIKPGEFTITSQKEVADRMGITQATFSRYEKPGGNLQVNTLQKIADALDVDFQQILSTWGER